MDYILILVGLAILALIGFVWWRYTSVARGARKRDAELILRLDPLAQKLNGGDSVDSAHVSTLAAQPELRPLLYELLKHFERLDLFPSTYLDRASQGAGVVAYWMMHPNELAAPPKDIELVEPVSRELDGRVAEFLVYRFRMDPKHWEAKEGWLLGLAGPFFDSSVPYADCMAFSRSGDRYGETAPSELVDWYIGMARR